MNRGIGSFIPEMRWFDEQLGTLQSLFPDKYVGQFDIHPDNRRFLMLKQAMLFGEEGIQTYDPLGI
jgi:hypothetical protein